MECGAWKMGGHSSSHSHFLSIVCHLHDVPRLAGKPEIGWPGIRLAGRVEFGHPFHLGLAPRIQPLSLHAESGRLSRPRRPRPLGRYGTRLYLSRPKAEFLNAAAGPLANLFVCLASATPLLFATGTDGLFQLLHPLKPVGVAHGPFLILFFKLIFWINWLLFLVNLFPVFPLDGGRVLRSGLLTIWPEMTEVTATSRIARGAQCAALGLFVAAWLVRDAVPAGPIPTWFALVLLSIFLFFAAQREIERQVDNSDEDDLFGYDFSQGYTSLDESQKQKLPSQASVFARWIEKRREQRQERKKVLEAEEEQRVDEILRRLNETGLKGLSNEERHLLDRVSARYRSRMDH